MCEKWNLSAKHRAVILPRIMIVFEAPHPSALRRHLALVTAGVLGLLCAMDARAQGDERLGDEYRFTLAPHHSIKGNLTGFEELGYSWSGEEDYQAFTALWPGLNYRAARWVQLTAGMRSLYTANDASADTLELRPFAGLKLLLPNRFEWHFYNYTRYEYRDTQDLDTHDWFAYHRIRSAFGVEIPLASRAAAWHPKTWYALAETEPYYRFDGDEIDPVRVRCGVGRILNDRLIVEFLYYAQFSRPGEGEAFEYAENMLRVNLKIGLNQGVLRRLLNPASEE